MHGWCTPGRWVKYLAREIGSYEEWGYRLDRTGLMPRLVEQVLAAPLPEGEAA